MTRLIWTAVRLLPLLLAWLFPSQAVGQTFETINVAALSCPYSFPPEREECFKPIVNVPYGSQTGYIHPQVARDLGVVPRANSLVKVSEQTSSTCYLGSLSLSSGDRIQLSNMYICGGGGTITLKAAKQITGTIVCNTSVLPLGIYKVIADAPVVNITNGGCGPNLVINQTALSAIDPYNALARATNGTLAPATIFNATGKFKNDLAKGVAADGAATLVLAFETQNQSGQAAFVIEGNAKGRLATYDANFGKGYAASSAAVTPPIVAIPKGDGTNAYYALALYKAPEMNEAFASKGATDVIAVTYNGQTYKLPIEIQAPPLLLAHGLWSDAGTWSSAWRTPAGYQPITVKAIEYNSTVDFASDLTRVQWGAWINTALTEARSRGFAVARVDVIGHSMGGLVARAFQQSSLFNSDVYGLGAYSLGRLYRTVTLNTPHRGSELASILWLSRNNPAVPTLCNDVSPQQALVQQSAYSAPVSAASLLGALVAIRDVCASVNQATTLQGIMALLDKPIAGAVQSLIPNSSSLSGVPALDANGIMLGTRQDTGVSLSSAYAQRENTKLGVILRTFADPQTMPPVTVPPWAIADAIFGDGAGRHDGVVSLSSQKNRSSGLGSADKIGPLHLDVTGDGDLASLAACYLARKASCTLGADVAEAATLDLRGYTYVPPIVGSNTVQVSLQDGKIQLGVQRYVATRIGNPNSGSPILFGCYVDNEGQSTEYWLNNPATLANLRACYFDVKRVGTVKVSAIEIFADHTFTVYHGEWETASNTDTNLSRELRVQPNAAIIKVGEQIQLTAQQHYPYDLMSDLPAANPAFSIGSSTNPIVSVSASGLVTGLREGVAQVTVAAEGQLAAADVTVSNVPADAARLSPGELVAAMLPASRAINRTKTATAFATMLNASPTTDAIGCTIGTMNNLDRAKFAFTATDPATNQIVGQQNQSVDIPHGEGRTFVIALSPNQVIPTETYQFAFSCKNSELAPIFSDLNTLLFTSSAGDVPDVIALAGTPGNDGIVRASEPGAVSGGVFVVATSNIGSPSTVRVRPVLRQARSDVTLLVCETNTSTGACLGPAAATVDTVMRQDTTASFSIFVFKAAGAQIPYDPARNRIVVQFEDLDSTPSGAIRGSTSVALQ